MNRRTSSTSLAVSPGDRSDPVAKRRPARHVGGAAARSDRATRALDLGLCLTAGVVVVLPVGLIVAALVKACDGGPVLYRGLRAGRYGEPFHILKFRTMRVDAAGPGITVNGDPRVTRLGRLLRRSKLDELPQLLNVLRGEMSLVGPRPEDPRFLDRSSPVQQVVLSVRPGLTSPASLRYRHEEALLVGPDWERLYREQLLPAKLNLDADFIARATVRDHLSILVRTLGACAAPRSSGRLDTPGRGRRPGPDSRVKDTL